jgi:hypothetical protein
MTCGGVGTRCIYASSRMRHGGLRVFLRTVQTRLIRNRSDGDYDLYTVKSGTYIYLFRRLQTWLGSMTVSGVLSDSKSDGTVSDLRSRFVGVRCSNVRLLCLLLDDGGFGCVELVGQKVAVADWFACKDARD